jgi:putative ABC transport system permease protein
MRIIGVVKDFNFESLHAEIKPYGFTKETFGNKFGYTIVSLKTSNYSRVLDEIGKTWTKLNPEVPFVYSFLDQDFQRNYEKERQTSAILGYFMVIAIFIACLGLFGLSAFSSEQRIKEIGVRKVLGASVANVTALLSKEYIRLIIIAILIGSPVAWYFMNTWLQRFAYRTSIDWWMFVLAGLLTVFVALITVSFQAIKAAIANPVKSLRTE